jgi:hypothetical protein
MRNFGCAFVCFLYVCVSLSLHTVKFLIFFFFKFVRSFSLCPSFLLCACLSLSLFPNQKKSIYLYILSLCPAGSVCCIDVYSPDRHEVNALLLTRKQNKTKQKLANRKQENLKFPFSYIFIDVVSYYLLVILDFSFLFDFFFAWSVVSLFFSPHFVSLFVRNHKHTRTLVPPFSLSLSLSLWQIVSSPNYYGLCFIVNFIYKHQKQLIRENYFLLFISFSAFRLTELFICCALSIFRHTRVAAFS